MASSFDRIEDGQGIPQHSAGQPDPEMQSVQPLASSLTTASSIVPTKQLSTLFVTFKQAFKRCKRRNDRPPYLEQRATESISAPLSRSDRHKEAIEALIRKQATQRCFLCFEKEQGQFAIAVRLFKPLGPRRYTSVRPRGSARFEQVCLEIGPEESDEAIYRRLTATCYQYQGAWKKWLPFYGITGVEEVYFEPAGRVQECGPFPIRMRTVDLSKIQEESDTTIAMQPDRMEIQFGDPCTDIWHNDRCRIRKEVLSEPCVVGQVSKAQERKRRLKRLDDLINCAMKPFEADGKRTLEGMAMDTCIYRIEEFEFTDELRGLRYTLGWQKNRLHSVLPRNIAWV